MLKQLISGLKLIGHSPLKSLKYDFDDTFYKSYYSDLRHLKTKRALWKHFSRHGLMEGRFRNAAEAMLALQRQFGPLPDDFNVIAYKFLNEDLNSIYDYEYQFVAHFLKYGQHENRPYKLKHASKRLSLESFKADQFIFSAYRWLSNTPMSAEQALLIFVDKGIDALAPINLDSRFDPTFYKLMYQIGGLRSDRDLYHHWLNIGIHNGYSPNEESFLRSFVSTRVYPESFDWRGYKESLSFKEQRKLHHRDDVLKHFFERGYERRLNKYVRGDSAADLYVALGNYHLIRGDYNLSRMAYDEAISSGDQQHGVFHRRGDAYLGLGNYANAYSDFNRAAQDSHASVWSHVNAARAAAKEGLFKESFDILLRAKPTWIKSIAFREAVGELIEMYFSERTRAAMTLYEAGNRVIADSYMIDTLDKVRDCIIQLESAPAKLNYTTNGHITILANFGLVQCNYYRIEQKRRQLKRAGFEVQIFDRENVAAFFNSLLGAKAAIFYRVPAFPSIMRAILTANALGIPTYYELDDLIFDSAYYPDTFESYGEQISKAEYAGLMYGVPLFNYAMSLCDHGIASTTALARHIEKIVKQKDCLVIRNGFDERNENALRMGGAERNEHSVVSIFYGSGTKAHNSDFNEIVGPALISVMETRPNTRLVIVGHLRLIGEFERLMDRIIHVEFVTDIDAYWLLLGACDINMAVLAPGEMSDCKSEIKWLEAAMLQIPSIVSGTATYREILVNQVDAMIADDVKTWRDALETLIADSELRKRIGAAARAKAIKGYSLDTAAEFWRNAFGGLQNAALTEQDLLGTKSCSSLGTKSCSSAVPKIKVLVCNVFFAPQSYGGATRVVEDNVEFIETTCDDIEVSVFCSDEGKSPSGRLRFDQFNGTPVFRISTPIEPNMDWHHFNVDNASIFCRLLESIQPDIIHFHCIQRLTGSIVEVAIKKNIPYIVTIHDGWWISDYQFLVDEDGFFRPPSDNMLDGVPPAGISLADSAIRRQRLRFLLNQAAAVVSVSESFTYILRCAGVQNVIAIPNGVSLIPAVPRKPRTDSRLSLGHIGGRSAHKGATLVEAVLRATTFENLRLTMIDGTMEPGARVERLWGNTPVTLCGPFSQDEIAELYASLDVLLCPSLWPETFGLVAREARALNLWVVASNRGAMAEDISHGKNGFVIDVSSGRGLAEILHTLDSDVERYRAPPPFDYTPIRTAAEQGQEVADLYRQIVRGGAIIEQ